MKVAVIGTGYVGLVVGTCFAESGNNVLCVDNDPRKIAQLKRGKSTIFEPGLQELITRNVKEKRLAFSTKIRDAVEQSSIIFLALPTPPREDGSADLRHVLEVSERIAHEMKEHKIVVLKSTVPVGTNEKVKKLFAKLTNVPVTIVSNPEFQKQGAAVKDFMSPDRVVVGTRDVSAANVMRELYSPFMRTSDRLILMDERSAELTKYAANSMLATKISFINEIANICDRLGADVEMVRRGLASDPRIGPQFLFPGVGYGGSCFPKDVQALMKSAEKSGERFDMLAAVESVNRRQKTILLGKILRQFSNNIKNKNIAVWGLSYKPRTDDLREAPSIVIINGLLKAGAKVRAHDPVANANAAKIFKSKVKFFEDCYDAIKEAEALVVVTEWNEFRRPDFERMKALMKQPMIFDGRNIYDPSIMREKGFVYFGIGRDGE
jgi:UDPglucose 6-dehydrogenase